MRKTIKNMQVADAGTGVTDAMTIDHGHNTVSIGAELLSGQYIGIFVDQGNDAGNWDLGDPAIVTINAATERFGYGATITPKVTSRYFRLRVVPAGADAVVAAEVETLYT